MNDLKQRGMLDETLIVWGGEFGRTPMAQGDVNSDNAGRDHHIRGFSMWLAGGGIKPGMSYGTTDELGYYARRKTRSTSTTCTPRCCICWASTTNG